jgi:hypothetical protein
MYRCFTDRRKGGNEWAGGKMDVSLCGRKERKNVWMEVRKNQ